VAFLLSFESKKGCANATIIQVSNNKRQVRSNHFFILELFLVCIESSFKKRTLVKYSFLKRRN
jgi:hypothetical protein